MKNLENIQYKEPYPGFFREEWIRKVLERLDTSKMTPQQRMFYEMTLVNNATVRADNLEHDRLVREKAHQEGIEQGIQEGIIQVAKKLKMVGEDEAMIAEVTGLSVEEIQQL